MKTIRHRQTFQKQLILDAVCSTSIHPTVEEVYQDVCARYANISKATVYRNLKLLSSQGKIRRIECPDGTERFDQAENPHYHAQCVGCGKIVDVQIPYCEQLDHTVQDRIRFDIFGHDIVFKGLCPHCKGE